VFYTDLEKLDIEVSNLEFKKHGDASASHFEPDLRASSIKGMSIADAKKTLAEFYGVSFDAIEIIITG